MAINLMAPSRRFQMALAWCGLFTMGVMSMYWLVNGWSESPLARLGVVLALLAGYAGIVYLLRRLYDPKGNRWPKKAAA